MVNLFGSFSTAFLSSKSCVYISMGTTGGLRVGKFTSHLCQIMRYSGHKDGGL